MKPRHIDQAAEYIRNGIAVGNLPAQCEAAADMLQRRDMALVPVEPTPGMIDAARACQLTCEYADIYRVMIAARDEDALPEGTALVPVEPTPKMLNAAAPFPEHLRAEHPDPADPWHELMRAATATDQAVARSTYRTMIAAREAEPS